MVGGTPDDDAAEEGAAKALGVVVEEGVLEARGGIGGLPCGAFALPRVRVGARGGAGVGGGAGVRDFWWSSATSAHVKDPGAIMLPVPERTSTAPGARAIASKTSRSRRVFTMPLACAFSSQ